LGEDGPTHQPVEHLAALRAIPNLLVMRPCDAVETAEAWEIALTRHEGPTLLALTRQNLKQMRFGGDLAHHTGQGAYEIEAAQADAQVSLFATGSEVEIASAAQALLSAKGIAARGVSVPCFELFAALPAADRLKVIGHAKVNVAIEAGLRMGWDAIIGSDGVFVGMTGFGASAPYKELYAHFGITAEAVVEQVMQRLH
jgi:transketolase